MTDPFERFDVTPQPPEADKELDHAALIDHGKRLTIAENHLKTLEEKIEYQALEMRRLRKLMEVWVSGH